MMERLPITLLIGAPGTNGHKIYNRITNDTQDTRVTAIAPWPRSKSTQAQGKMTFVRTTERLKRLGQGCACCTVRGDILSRVRQIIGDDTTDRLMIQVAPQSDLDVLSKTFSVADDNGEVLGEVAVVDSVVTIVDGSNMLDALKTDAAQRLIDMVRNSYTVWIDGFEGLSSQVKNEIKGALSVMNPNARVVHGDDGAIKFSGFGEENTTAPSTIDPQACDIDGGL